MQGPHSPDAKLIAELNHQINSPLAAIRNALYLAGCRSGDPDLHRYLQLADQEIAAIADTLNRARTRVEVTARQEAAFMDDSSAESRGREAVA